MRPSGEFLDGTLGRRFDALMDALSAFSSLGVRPGLERTARLLALLGSPQNRFPAIQVLGTNGKGSTAATLESILQAAGLKTALYTSPHLISLRERLRVGGEELPAALWEDAFDRLKTVVEKDAELRENRPTFFENLTALCCLLIAEASVDVAVVEAGMGGRYDSTTACDAIATLITPIGMDHMEYLGNTLGEIAEEKFAAVKPGVPAFYAGDDASLADAFLARCGEIGAPACLLDRCGRAADVRCSLAGTFFSYCGGDDTHPLRDLHTPLVGVHQAENAVRAVSFLRAMRGRHAAFSTVDEAAIRAGLETTYWPGRLEAIRPDASGPTFLLDGAHNLHGMRALLASIACLRGGEESPGVPASVIFGVMRDKDTDGLLDLLRGLDRPIYCTQTHMKRALPADVLAQRARERGLTVAGAFPEPGGAIAAARRDAMPGDCVLCCGSLYLIGPLRKELLCGDD